VSPLKTLVLLLSLDDEQNFTLGLPSLEQNTTEICQRLFHGMATDEPPGLADLERFTLKNGCWNRQSAEALHHLLASPNHSRLNSLRLRTKLGIEENLPLLLSSLQSNNCRLIELDLTDSNIGDVGAKQLAQVLFSQNNTTLRILAMWGNQIGNAGAAAIAAALLDSNRTLTTLALGNNQIGDTGVEALLKAIANHPTLTYFQIHQNPITIKGRQALVDAIPHLRHVNWFIFTLFDWKRRLPRPRHDVATVKLIRQVAAGMANNYVIENLGVAEDKIPQNLNDRTLYSWQDYQRYFPAQETLFFPPTLRMDEVHGGSSRNEKVIFDSVVLVIFFLQLNRLGLRHALLHEDLRPGLWPIILSRVSCFAPLLFYLLREKPELVTRVPMSTEERAYSSPKFYLAHIPRLRGLAEDNIHFL
jgi:hypothetical protein